MSRFKVGDAVLKKPNITDGFLGLSDSLFIVKKVYKNKLLVEGKYYSILKEQKIDYEFTVDKDEVTHDRVAMLTQILNED